MNDKELPVVIIGAGPIGLAAAAHLYQNNIGFIILEQGKHIASNVKEWGHVQLFTSWKDNIDNAAKIILKSQGWSEPISDKYPSGKELIDLYLEPLSNFFYKKGNLFTSTKAIKIGHWEFDKLSRSQNHSTPFLIKILKEEGKESYLKARNIIDATGNYTQPNPLGVYGGKAIGEHALNNRIFYGLPNVASDLEERYASKNILVVGGGHSAMNTIIDLSKLKEKYPSTFITWVIRPETLPEVKNQKINISPKEGLLQKATELTKSKIIKLVPGFKIIELTNHTDKLTIISNNGKIITSIDEIIGTTGFRPDPELTSELNISVDSKTESLSSITNKIDSNKHSCGIVEFSINDLINHNEEGYYRIGMKSYGRAPSFLLSIGYNQAEIIVKEIAKQEQN